MCEVSREIYMEGWKEGVIEGFKQGFIEGFKQGFKEGLAEAKLEKTKDMAIRLMDMGYSIEIAAKATKVETSEITQWLEERAVMAH